MLCALCICSAHKGNHANNHDPKYIYQYIQMFKQEITLK